MNSPTAPFPGFSADAAERLPLPSGDRLDAAQRPPPTP